jgi:hypothetical protein
MPAAQSTIFAVHELSTEALRRGPVIVSGLARASVVSVLWYENDLLLRRDFDDERRAFGLARAIKSAGAHQPRPDGELALAVS